MLFLFSGLQLNTWTVKPFLGTRRISQRTKHTWVITSLVFTLLGWSLIKSTLIVINDKLLVLAPWLLYTYLDKLQSMRVLAWSDAIPKKNQDKKKQQKNKNKTSFFFLWPVFPAHLQPWTAARLISDSDCVIVTNTAESPWPPAQQTQQCGHKVTVWERPWTAVKIISLASRSTHSHN